jgi:large subunit ribosomal protein L22
MTQKVNATQKYIRTSARKLRLIADMIRHLSVNNALTQLSFSTKRAAKTMHKILIQAQQNAINTKELESNSLMIQEIKVDEGPTFKRWRPVSRGRAHEIMKRTSHVKITVSGTSRHEAVTK